MIQAILAFVFLIGLGFILGYITKQDDAYERGYFFGRAEGRTEVFNLWNNEKNNIDDDSDNPNTIQDNRGRKRGGPQVT